ncbi:hypothetical protein LTR62_001823 [Meristemomyces frigidus]|uniref:Uncharacterized protein n=1 Tax=Meristemomyces frigidus TaxID=1508187 RepID=A0AAN7TG32_9PEZI|nr:hypothetical protein LTR62_001823 [Meristemomyces frigidus]
MADPQIPRCKAITYKYPEPFYHPDAFQPRTTPTTARTMQACSTSNTDPHNPTTLSTELIDTRNSFHKAATYILSLLIFLMQTLTNPFRKTYTYLDSRLPTTTSTVYILSVDDRGGHHPSQSQPYHRTLATFTSLHSAQAAVTEILSSRDFLGRKCLGVHFYTCADGEAGMRRVLRDGDGDGDGRGCIREVGRGDGGVVFGIERMGVRWR